MANIRVSYAEIEGAAVQLKNGSDEITQKLESLQTIIQNLVTSGFVTDRASGKFNQVYADYTFSAKNTILKLDEIQMFLKNTAEAMRTLDQQIAAQIN